MAAAIGVAVVVTVISTYEVRLSPLGINERSSSAGLGSAEVLVDAEQSLLGSIDADIAALAARAAVFAVAGKETSVRDRIGRAARIDPTSVAIDSTVESETQVPNPETAAPKVSEGRSRTVAFVAVSASPVVTIATAAPTARQARQLASAAQQALVALAKERSDQASRIAPPLSPSGVPPANAQERAEARQYADLRRVTLRPLGPPKGGRVVTTEAIDKGAAFGAAALIALCALILGLDRMAVRPPRTA